MQHTIITSFCGSSCTTFKSSRTPAGPCGEIDLSKSYKVPVCFLLSSHILSETNLVHMTSTGSSFYSWCTSLSDHDVTVTSDFVDLLNVAILQITAGLLLCCLLSVVQYMSYKWLKSILFYILAGCSWIKIAFLSSPELSDTAQSAYYTGSFLPLNHHLFFITYYVCGAATATQAHFKRMLLLCLQLT